MNLPTDPALILAAIHWTNLHPGQDLPLAKYGSQSSETEQLFESTIRIREAIRAREEYASMPAIRTMDAVEVEDWIDFWLNRGYPTGHQQFVNLVRRRAELRLISAQGDRFLGKA